MHKRFQGELLGEKIGWQGLVSGGARRTRKLLDIWWRTADDPSMSVVARRGLRKLDEESASQYQVVPEETDQREPRSQYRERSKYVYLDVTDNAVRAVAARARKAATQPRRRTARTENCVRTATGVFLFPIGQPNRPGYERPYRKRKRPGQIQRSASEAPFCPVVQSWRSSRPHRLTGG